MKWPLKKSTHQQTRFGHDMTKPAFHDNKAAINKPEAFKRSDRLYQLPPSSSQKTWPETLLSEVVHRYDLRAAKGNLV